MPPARDIFFFAAHRRLRRISFFLLFVLLIFAFIVLLFVMTTHGAKERLMLSPVDMFRLSFDMSAGLPRCGVVPRYLRYVAA